MNVAVLKNDSAQSDLVRRILTAEGYFCHVFESTSLMRELRRRTYDLLILDWEAVDTSGEDVLHWVRKNHSSQLPVLFISSRNLDTDVSAILNAGADDYIVKPVSPGILLARVTALLRRAYNANCRRERSIR